MTTPTIRYHCAALTCFVYYLLACIRDGSSDSATLEECLDHANAARDALAAAPVGEGPSADELIGLALGCEPWATWLRSGGCLESAHCELADLMLAALARWGRPAAPPAPEPPAEALAARPLLEQVARLGDAPGIGTVARMMAISARANAWLEANPSGRPVVIEPRGCPTPGACSCVEPAPPAPVERNGELSAKELKAQNAIDDHTPEWEWV